MMELGGFTPEQARALWQDYQRRQGMPNDSNVSSGPQRGYQRPVAVILDEALEVATHALTGATSALATRCDWSVADEEYTEAAATVDQITVWNHSESDAFEADTFGFAKWIDGHWVFFGDCGPMAAR